MAVSCDDMFNISIIMVFFILGVLVGMFIIPSAYGEMVISPNTSNSPPTGNLPSTALCCQQFGEGQEWGDVRK